MINDIQKLHRTGNEELFKRIKTAFLCSRQIPENKTNLVYNWANQLSAKTDCIICGNHSRMEQEIFNILLKRHIPTILILAEGLSNNWNAEVEAALKTNQLLIITACNDSVHRVNKTGSCSKVRG